MITVKYVLWAATLLIASWAIALISAVVAGKGGIVRIAGTDQVPLPEVGHRDLQSLDVRVT